MNFIKKYKKLLIFLIIIFIYIFIMCYTHIGMKFLPKGDLIASVESPDGTYTLNLYDDAGWETSKTGQLVNNETGTKKIIYFSDSESKSDVKWINKKIVSINNVKLNIYKDYVIIEDGKLRKVF